MARFFGWVFRLLTLALVALLLLKIPQVQIAAQALWSQISPPTAAALTVTKIRKPANLGPVSVEYTPPRDGFDRYEFTFDGKTRSFWMLSAQKGATGGSLPSAVLLLHGSNRAGTSMLDMWRAIAAQGTVLIAPDSLNPMVWQLDTDGAAFQEAVLAQAMAITPFDRDKVSLYGHSAGANGALELGQCTDLPLVAIALHAGAFSGCNGWARALTRRYLIQIGDHDESFPLDTVYTSAKLIAASGSAVDLMVIEDHNHWFYQIGPSLAQQAWQFFQK